MDNLTTWKQPKWGPIDAELGGMPCCGNEATTICTAISADNSCKLVMYLCDSCREKWMAFMESGGVGLWTP